MLAITKIKKSLFHYYRLRKFLRNLNLDKFSSSNYFKSRDYYAVVLNQYIKAENYINIFSSKVDLSSLHTDIDILPNLLGKSVKNIIRTKGKPNYIFQEKDLSIFVYKLKINGINDRCEIHFYKNKVFLVNHNYQSINETEKKYVINAVEKKYLNKDNLNLDISTYKISDNNNNMIFIDNVMGLKINYFGNKESEWFIDMSLEIKAKNVLKNTQIRLRERHFVANI